jgi:uncharacterized membrane protein
MVSTPARIWIAVLLIIAVAAGVRLWHIGRQPLWVDELYSMETSAGHGFAAHWNLPRAKIGPAPDLIGLASARPWWAVPLVMGNDTHPPLYFILLRAWRELFGDTEAVARALATLASIVGIPLLFLLGRDLLGTAAALWACAIYAVAGPQIQLAQEVRGYTLLVTLTLASALLITRIERSDRVPRHIALAGCIAAMLLTHYFAAGPIAGLVLYVLLRFRGRLRWKCLGAIAVGGLVFAVAWGPMVLRQFGNIGDTNDWVLESSDGNAARTLLRAALLPARYLNEPMQTSVLLAAAAGLLYFLPLVTLKNRPGLLLPYLVFVSTVLFVAVLDLARAAHQLEFVRYTLPAAPFVYLILAGLVPRGRVMPHVLPAMAIVSCLVSLPRAYTYIIPPKPDWPWMTARMTENGPVDTLFLVGPGPHTWITANYLGLYYYLDPKPKYVVVLNDAAFIDTEALHSARGAVWAFSLPGESAVLPDGFEAAEAFSAPNVGAATRLRPIQPASLPAP